MRYNITISDDIFLPIYQPMRLANADIKILYGGRDSGKSYHFACELVEEILLAPAGKFKCVFARKTFKSIRDSQYELVKSVINDWGLSQFFTFRSQICEIEFYNGNKFISRGCDDPQNIKSVVNPTHAWYEEANQMELSDYTTVSTTLRGNDVDVKEYISFNPECDGDYRNFWIYKNWFSHTTEKSFQWNYTVTTDAGSVTRRVYVVHSTYRDNPFCTPTRSAKLEDLKFTNPYYYRVYCLGEWGVRENKSPAIVTFVREKHVGKTVREMGQPVYLSFDFNRNPMCCSVIQFSGNKVRWLEVIKIPNSNIEQMCDQIMLRYPYAIYICCGDYAGNQQRAEITNTDYNTYWKIIKAKLRLTDGQLQYVPNPKVEDNLGLVNHCLYHLDVVFDEEKCQPAIFDMQFAELQADGKLRKGDRNDPTQQLDVLDTIRYFFNRYFSHMSRVKK